MNPTLKWTVFCLVALNLGGCLLLMDNDNDDEPSASPEYAFDTEPYATYDNESDSQTSLTEPTESDADSETDSDAETDSDTGTETETDVDSLCDITTYAAIDFPYAEKVMTSGGMLIIFSLGKVAVYDISDREKPVLQWGMRDQFFANDMTVYNGRIYILEHHYNTGSTPLLALSVTSGSSVFEQIPYDVDRLVATNGYIYCTLFKDDFGRYPQPLVYFSIQDYLNNDDQLEVYSFDGGGDRHFSSVFTNGDLILSHSPLGDYDETIRLNFVDVSVPATPKLVQQYDVPGGFFDMDFVGDSVIATQYVVEPSVSSYDVVQFPSNGKNGADDWIGFSDDDKYTNGGRVVVRDDFVYFTTTSHTYPASGGDMWFGGEMMVFRLSTGKRVFDPDGLFADDDYTRNVATHPERSLLFLSGQEKLYITSLCE